MYLLSNFYFRYALLEFKSVQLAEKNYALLNGVTFKNKKLIADYVGEKSLLKKPAESKQGLFSHTGTLPFYFILYEYKDPCVM